MEIVPSNLSLTPSMENLATASSYQEGAPYSGLSQVFKHDHHETAEKKADSAETTVAPSTPSFWRNAWRRATTTDTENTPIERSERQAVAPISHIPSVERPDYMPEELAEALVLPNAKSGQSSKTPLSHEQIVEGLSQMSPHSFQQLIRIAMKAQLELERENAETLKSTHSKYQQFQQSQLKEREEIRNVLAKDEKVGAYFGTGKKLMIAVSFCCSVVGLVASAGLLAAPTVSAWAFAGASATAGFSALAGGGDLYFKQQTKKAQAQHEGINSLQRQSTHGLNDAREGLMETVRQANATLDQAINQAKRNKSLSSSMIK